MRHSAALSPADITLKARGSCVRAAAIGVCALLAAAAPALAVDDAEHLDQIRSQLAAARQALSLDADKLSAVREKAFEVEREIERATRRQTDFEHSIQLKRERIATLKQRRRGLEGDLAESRSVLERNAVARYVLATQPPLKLLLNQSEAGTMSRHLAYYDYAMSAYTRDLTTLTNELIALSETESALKLETNALRQLRSSNNKHLVSLNQLRSDHGALIEDIERRMAAGDKRVELLREDERRLLTLLEQLAGAAASSGTSAASTPAAPFGSLKGKLAWPASGRVAKTPGSALREGGARWAGVFIAGKPGEDVSAVAAGEIVFADWFRNLGKLVIVDHGGGYMTLYGNNAEVHRKAGDNIDAGDTIATIGAGSGEMPAGVYFELRNNGEPLDRATRGARAARQLMNR